MRSSQNFLAIDSVAFGDAAGEVFNEIVDRSIVLEHPGTFHPFEVRGALGFFQHIIEDEKGQAEQSVFFPDAEKDDAVSPAGKICLDCGASTGGFTDCLLRGGAEKVYAIDVGYGQLAWRIRNHERVVAMERTNIRYVTHEQVPDPIDLATIDVSFISLKLVLPVLRQLLAPTGEVVCLIKPQFEAGREKVGKKGVVRELETHVEVLEGFLANAGENGFAVVNLTYSPIKGPEGNIEYLGHLKMQGASSQIDARAIAEQSHMELNEH